MRVVTDQGYRVELDLTPQVLRVDAREEFTARLDWHATELALLATLPAERAGEFVSASVLAQKAKQFEDGLYAAVELAAQRGAGKFDGKVALLRLMGAALAEVDPQLAGEAPEIIFSAAELGGLGVMLPEWLRAPVRNRVEGFLADELRSKPIGFYTWSAELRSIFQQDRMLQTELATQSGCETLVRILRGSAQASRTYADYLTLVSRLTNPLAWADLRSYLVDSGTRTPIKPEKVSFFPPSRAYETDLAKTLLGPRSIPDDFDLADEMIRRIRSGELRLKPSPDSGWYDHQTWALEPLVVPEKMPEGDRLRLGAGYCKLLLDLFKGLLALTRETHIKQLEAVAAGAAYGGGEPRREPIYIAPELSAEPLPTYYLRRARTYEFVRGVLESAFGPEALDRMHRLTAAGPRKESLDEELALMQSLMRGACVTVSRELGMVAEAGMSEGSGARADSDVARFRQWKANLAADPDVGADARAMVPVFYDVERRKTKVWVVLGWAETPVLLDFATPPAFKVFDGRTARIATHPPEIRFTGAAHPVFYPITAEVYVSRLLDRPAFQKLCDTHRTPSAILAHLQ